MVLRLNRVRLVIDVWNPARVAVRVPSQFDITYLLLNLESPVPGLAKIIALMIEVRNPLAAWSPNAWSPTALKQPLQA
jgi:hypothetical protein